MSTQAIQPTKAVLPSVKACMACRMSGEDSSTRSRSEPSTTPTITPASSRRSVCCTPRAKTSVSTTAPAAPRKAMPVMPMRASHCAAIGDTPNKAMATAPPSAAPEALPSR